MQNVLLADDLATLRCVLRSHLGELAPDARITEAVDAREAVTLLTGNPFDIIFLDTAFTDGTPVADVLDAMLATRPDARIVVTSTRSREHPLVHAALTRGAYDHLAKPVKRDEVHSLLARIEREGPRAEA